MTTRIRIEPTPEDMVIVQRNLRRLMRWCAEAGVPIRSQRAVVVSKNFVFDMMGVNSEDLTGG